MQPRWVRILSIILAVFIVSVVATLLALRIDVRGSNVTGDVYKNGDLMTTDFGIGDRDTIETKSGTVIIRIQDDRYIKVFENSKIRLSFNTKTTRLSIEEGKALVELKKDIKLNNFFVDSYNTALSLRYNVCMVSARDGVVGYHLAKGDAKLRVYYQARKDLILNEIDLFSGDKLSIGIKEDDRISANDVKRINRHLLKRDDLEFNNFQSINDFKQVFTPFKIESSKETPRDHDEIWQNLDKESLSSVNLKNAMINGKRVSKLDLIPGVQYDITSLAAKPIKEIIFYDRQTDSITKIEPQLDFYKTFINDDCDIEIINYDVMPDETVVHFRNCLLEGNIDNKYPVICKINKELIVKPIEIPNWKFIGYRVITKDSVKTFDALASIAIKPYTQTIVEAIFKADF